MNRKNIFLFFCLLSVVWGINTPQVVSRVYNNDYSVDLQGVLVSKNSWTSSRLVATEEESMVSCATICVDKYKEDCTCDSMMYVRETKECHLGKTTLPIGQEATEFVYRISNERGKNKFCSFFKFLL